MALGNGDPDRVEAPGAGIVLSEVAAQPADLDAHDRVVLRIEALVPAEHGKREVERLEPVCVASQGLLDHIRQQLAAARAGGERLVGEQRRQIGLDFGRRRIGLVARPQLG